MPVTSKQADYRKRTKAVKADQHEQIVSLHCDGKPISAIAEKLGIAEETVLYSVCWFMHYGIEGVV